MAIRSTVRGSKRCSINLTSRPVTAPRHTCKTAAEHLFSQSSPRLSSVPMHAHSRQAIGCLATRTRRGISRRRAPTQKSVQQGHKHQGKCGKSAFIGRQCVRLSLAVEHERFGLARQPILLLPAHAYGRGTHNSVRRLVFRQRSPPPANTRARLHSQTGAVGRSSFGVRRPPL